MVAADLAAGGLRRGGGVCSHAARLGVDPGARGARTGQRWRQQRCAPEGPLRHDSRRPLADDAPGVATAQPGVHAPPRRHALDPTRSPLRRSVRSRRDRLHDDRDRPGPGPHHCVRALQPGRRRRVRPRRHSPDLRAVERPRWVRRRRRSGRPLPGVVLGSGSGGLLDPDRVRLPAPEQRRDGADDARDPPSRVVRPRRMAPPARRHRLRGPCGRRGDVGGPDASLLLRGPPQRPSERKGDRRGRKVR